MAEASVPPQQGGRAAANPVGRATPKCPDQRRRSLPGCPAISTGTGICGSRASCVPRFSRPPSSAARDWAFALWVDLGRAANESLALDRTPPTGTAVCDAAPAATPGCWASSFPIVSLIASWDSRDRKNQWPNSTLDRSCRGVNGSPRGTISRRHEMSSIFQISPPNVTMYAVFWMISIELGWFRPSATTVKVPSPLTRSS